MQDIPTPTGSVIAVARDGEHRFSKQTVPEIRLVVGLGVDGDAHYGATVQHLSRQRSHPDEANLRQVHLIQQELFDELAGQGYRVKAADLGENITTAGLDLLALPRDTLLAIGDSAVLKLTGLRNPCSQIDGLQDGLMAAVSLREPGRKVALKGGVMTAVVAGGVVRPGDAITVELPPEPHQTLEVI